MEIKKGTVLNVNHSRSGKWVGIADRDFNTEDKWYPINLHQEKPVYGMSSVWVDGDEMPCRGSFVKLEVKE